MRGPFLLSIHQTAGGRYKVYVTGHHDEHLMDWAGANYRHTPISDQPRRGFVLFEEAESLLARLEKTPALWKHDAERARQIGGSYLPDWTQASRCNCQGCRKPMVGLGIFCKECPSPHSFVYCAKHRPRKT